MTDVPDPQALAETIRDVIAFSGGRWNQLANDRLLAAAEILDGLSAERARTEALIEAAEERERWILTWLHSYDYKAWVALTKLDLALAPPAVAAVRAPREPAT